MCRDLESFINASKSRWQPVPRGVKHYCKLCNMGPLVPKTVDALGPNTGRDAIAMHRTEVHPPALSQTLRDRRSSVSYLEPRTHEEERIQLAAAIAASQSGTTLDSNTSSPSVKRRRLLSSEENSANSSPSSISGSPYAIVPQTKEEEEEHLATALEASQASFRCRSPHSTSSAGGPSTSSVSSLGFTNSSASDSSGFSRSSTGLPSSLSPGLAEAAYVWNPAVLNYVRSAYGSSRSGSVASSNQDEGQDGQDVKGKGKAVVKTEYSERISDLDIIDLTVDED
ncbi:uncharacterized protein TRAVEDRAFT_23799 [Trametes versicolor FP-101664 SS1]|uniref:uncharacterized protein n=1 Tax=Trametes versicolor (strain FP-101664) TaxID=717944 RepID=UPI0004623978|nr:uncharacterized protein TRAVEDRAFT_23799 [Trametes versicolor FP-101664 SS1]EIW53442.1 hypothetical protein TRAVEDRAFT_23799 [Trametes versicolor FP-101664 SS1]